MNYAIVIILYVLTFIILYLYFTRKLRKHKNLQNETQASLNQPVYINPVFKIVYEKESLEDEDIDTLANYVINFSSISPKSNLTESVNSPDENNYFVKFNSIQFNQLIKIKL